MRLDISDYYTEEAFSAKIERLMQQVAHKIDPDDHTLVAFPEDVGLMLIVQGLGRELGGVSGIAQAIAVATRRFFLPVGWLRLRHKLSWVPALFLYRHRVIASTYFSVFSRAARKYGVWIVAGSVILPPYAIRDGQVRWQDGYLRPQVHNSSFLFGPDGAVIGRQDKVHLIDMEQSSALDLSPAPVERIQSFTTPFGNVGIAICLDAFEDSVIDALVRCGTDILVQPSANPGPWTPEQQTDWLRSSYSRAFLEGRFAYAINPMMHGSVWDVAFFGQSSIVARDVKEPITGYTDLGPMPGFQTVAASDSAEEVLVLKVDT